MPFSLHTRFDAEPIGPSLVPPFISEHVTEQYFDVALLAILVYHSVITKDKEVRYFWPNPWNSVSLVYFANYYIGILSAISPLIYNGFKESLAICRFSVWTQGVANLITMVIIDYILLIRVLALYHQSKMLSIFLKILLGFDAAAVLGCLIYVTLSEEVAVASLANGVMMCGENRAAPVELDFILWPVAINRLQLLLIYIRTIPMAYGLVLLIFALYKAAEYWRLSNRFKGFYLVAVLMQDQVIYYGFVTICCVLNIVEIHIVGINEFAANMLYAAGSLTLLCVLGGQLLINLKEAGERGANGGTNYRSNSISDIEFA